MPCCSFIGHDRRRRGVRPGSAQTVAGGSRRARCQLQGEHVPIFQANWVSCDHAPDGQGYKISGLDLTSYQGVMKGTKFGSMVVRDDPDNSNLMWLPDWKASPVLRMPQGKEQLPASERDTIRTRIRQGAKDN